MFLHTLSTKQIKRFRGVFQILLTLFSFFGFNEAVLAARYRNSLYISNFDARMTMAESPMAEPLWLGYASSGEHPDLVKDPGNLHYKESPVRLMEYALKDLESSVPAHITDKTVDVVIGIAGFDFFRKKPAPKRSELKHYYGLSEGCTGSQFNKEAFLSCMVKRVYQQHGWTVEKVVITGDHNLMASAARSWLEKQQLNGENFDLMQATTAAVPYQIRSGDIVEYSARLPKHLQQSGGYYDLGLRAQTAYFKEWEPGKEQCQPMHAAYGASDYVQSYDKEKGKGAMFNWWERSGLNSLGYQTARITSDKNKQDYTTGANHTSESMYLQARHDAQGLMNRVIDQLVEIINLKQEEYYQGRSERIWPIVIMGEFAADVLETGLAKKRLLERLPEQDRARVMIVPGDDFFYNLSLGGKQLLKTKD